MRKITSKHDERGKAKRNQVILGIGLVVIMFLSVLGYSFQGGDDSGVEKMNYNGFEFVSQNGLWLTNIGDFIFIFKHNPNEIVNIDSNLKDLNNYYGKPLYISSGNEEAEAEIYINLFSQNRIVQRMQKACLNKDDCKGSFPVKNCTENFIIIKEGNTEIVQDENCVFLKGAQDNLTLIADEFLFKVLGIAQ